mgnify:CR=1 FL=1
MGCCPMRVFATSDLHVDFPDNLAWVQQLSMADHTDDVLLVAGDVSDALARVGQCIAALSRRFRRVLFVPGNHELWVVRQGAAGDSLAKFDQVLAVARDSGATTGRLQLPGLCIAPLWSWYDYSFGPLNEMLKTQWSDFHACRWPGGLQAPALARHFLARNDLAAAPGGCRVVTVSHFLPRADLMPARLPPSVRDLLPVLGSAALDGQVRQLGACLHVYGHSHLNRQVLRDGVMYVNAALGYPREGLISARRLLHIDPLLPGPSGG